MPKGTTDQQAVPPTFPFVAVGNEPTSPKFLVASLTRTQPFPTLLFQNGQLVEVRERLSEKAICGLKIGGQETVLHEERNRDKPLPLNTDEKNIPFIKNKEVRDLGYECFENWTQLRRVGLPHCQVITEGQRWPDHFSRQAQPWPI